MADSELEKYIKKQRESGVPDSEIKEALLSAGWDEEVVSEALYSNLKTWFFIGTTTLAALILLIFIFAGEDSPGESTGLNSCTDLGCLSNMAKNCTPSEATHSSTTNIFGTVIITAETLYQVQPSNGSCSLKMKLLSTEAKMNETVRQQYLESGAEGEELKALETQLNSTNSAVQEREGTEGICTFKSGEEVSRLLQNWNEGNINTQVSCDLGSESSECAYGGDLENATCSGKYFSQ